MVRVAQTVKYGCALHHDTHRTDKSSLVCDRRTANDALTRLRLIAEIIEGVESRCMAVDGPVTPTLQEMTEEELRRIYRLAKKR